MFLLINNKNSFRFPQIVVSVNLTDSIVSLLEEKIDLAVRIGDFEDNQMRVQKLGINKRIVCASPNIWKSMAFLAIQKI